MCRFSHGETWPEDGGGGIFEKSFTSGGSATGVKKYYGALGRAVAVRDVPSGTGAGTLQYLLTDHLGGTVEALDAGGVTLSEMKYWPYGATRQGGVTPTDKLFTGQRQEPGDSALGLYNYKARFYSTTLGRFVSADPVAQSVGDPQMLNRYSYVRNNPQRFNDPSGLCVQRPGGEWMRCSRTDMIRFFFCAWGGECNTGGYDEDSVRTYARAVVSSDPFRLFVAIESSRHGDISLHYTVQSDIETLTRYGLFPGGAPGGSISISYSVNASQRKINYAYGEFIEGEGDAGIPSPLCGRFFCVGPRRLVTGGGWTADIDVYYTDTFASVSFSDVGPHGNVLANPVGIAHRTQEWVTGTGVGVEVQSSAMFRSGELVVNPLVLRKVGGIPVPYVDVLNFRALRWSYEGY